MSNGFKLARLPQCQRQDQGIRVNMRKGFCPPCSRALATAGYTGQPWLCHDCETRNSRDAES